jgi:transposase
MDEVTLYERILQLQSPWYVERVELDEASHAVTVHVAMDESVQLACPMCGKSAPRYDKRERRWRHLDTCQYQTYVVAEVPRVQCGQHGCLTVEVSWAQRNSRFTQMFEAMVIGWLLETSIAAIARHLQLSWNAVDGIMRRAVARGLQRRKRRSLRRIGVDEVSFNTRREYVTIVTDQRGHVIAVENDRSKASLKAFYDRLTNKQKMALQAITMDMAPAYVAVTLEEIPDAVHRIAFDKFHVAQALTEAVDEVRKSERLQLIRTAHYDALKGQRFLWLRNSATLDLEQRSRLSSLRSIARNTGRAWSLKEYAMSLWHYRSKGWAENAWSRWFSWAVRSRLMPIKAVASSIKKNLWGIINAIVMKADNAMAESVNSKIRMLKIKARGFRNRARFKTAILFHYGGLSLSP